MTQDNQNSQPPFSPEPETNRSKPTVQPAWKSAIIQILRGTIGVLETTVEKLETASPPGTETTAGFFQKLALGWSATLGKIRSLLPANLSTKLSDTALTGIIAGIAVILVWTTSSVFSSKPTEVATVPPTEEAPPATIAIPPQLEAPPAPPAAEQTPPPIAEITPQPEETSPPVAEITPQPEETPPPVEETPPPEPEPTPTPTLVLTPEQTLIASIENQVAQISDRFASGLIQSIQANFRSSSLAVTISDGWYDIKQSQQDQLLAQMLQRAKEMDFSHLDILDSQGRLVARNPVVGTDMIIFQRRAIS
jgi:hypothetical protein